MIDKNLLIARIKCQIVEINNQNQINIELDRSSEALGNLLCEYRTGYTTVREIENFMSKNTKRLSDYTWNEDNTYITFKPDITLPHGAVTPVIQLPENDTVDSTMTEERLIEQLKSNADKIVRIRKYNSSLSSIIERKTNTLKLVTKKNMFWLGNVPLVQKDKNKTTR